MLKARPLITTTCDEAREGNLIDLLKVEGFVSNH